jgi:class I fructose-bisphosphate aldolase
MSIGKRVRLNRLFGHPSGRFCSIAVDHFIGYGEGLPPGLRPMRATLAAIVAGQPDAVTMHRGMALSAWEPHAGRVPLILQSSLARPDDSVREQVLEAEEAVRLGAEALAVAGFVRGATEGRFLRTVAETAQAAARCGMPLIVHVYPREFRDGAHISYAPEDIAWAVRGVWECGADVIKVPFCNEAKAFAQIVAECAVPVVIAGGPQTATLQAALEMFSVAVNCGARGVTVGRNVWAHPQITAVVRALKAVVHEGRDAPEALRCEGLA